MSTLANFLEREGIATAVVSLVDAQSAPAAPPRVLWVPFELGRPLGEPMDAAFQTQVLGELLALFDEPSGPVRREFAADPARAGAAAAWSAPDLKGAVSVADEIKALAPHHAEFLAAAGRSTVALSGLDVDECARFVCGFEDGYRPVSESSLSDILRFRFAADDLKAYYLEAASRGRTDASTRQLQSWLWNETRLGQTLVDFWRGSADCNDRRRELVGGRFIVPTDWRTELGA